MGKNIRQVTFDLLRELGLTTIFGNPGSTEETFLKNFPDDFRYILALHEASVVGIAAGYAMGTHKPALVNVHTSAGVANSMSNIMTAAQSHIPLIVTAGQQTREMLLLEPWLTNLDPEILPKPWVKWSYQPVRAEDVPAAFMRAYAEAVQPPAGPVFLSIPLDDWDKPALGAATVRTVGQRVAPDPDRLREFAQALDEAKNPALIFGASVARSQGWSQAIALAEKLQAKVYTAPASEECPFPETHRLFNGGLPFAQGLLSKKLEGHDVALVVGAPVFRYYPWVPGDYLPPGLTLLHITEDPSEASRAPVGNSLVSDAVLAIDALTELISQQPPAQSVSDDPDYNPAGSPASETHKDEKNTSNPDTLSAYDLFKKLRDVFPQDTILVSETPSNLPFLHKAWPIETPNSYYTLASGSLGWDLPASVGLALAEKDTGRNRPVVGIIGDGSLQYSIQSLYTAAQLGLNIIYVVPQNNEYAILKSFAELEETPGVPGLDIPGLDIVSLARGYGVTALKITELSQIKEQVSEGLHQHGPTLLVVPIEKTIPTLV